MLTPEDFREAMELAKADGMAKLEALADILAPGGVSFDAESLTDTEFLPWYLDLWHSNAAGPAEPPFTTMDYLPTVAPDLYAELNARFQRLAPRRFGGV